MIIVEDHQVVTQGLAALLNDQPDMTVIASAGSVSESMVLAEQHAADVILIDFRLPDGNGAEVGARIRELHPDVKLVFLTRDDSDGAHIAAVEAGTMSAQLQSLTARERDVLRLVAAGVASRDIASRLGISYTTVRTHIRSLGRKLQVHSKIEATAKARELGLVE